MFWFVGTAMSATPIAPKALEDCDNSIFTLPSLLVAALKHLYPLLASASSALVEVLPVRRQPKHESGNSMLWRIYSRI